MVPGENITGYVNPDDPSEAVLVRQSWYELLIGTGDILFALGRLHLQRSAYSPVAVIEKIRTGHPSGEEKEVQAGIQGTNRGRTHMGHPPRGQGTADRG